MNSTTIETNFSYKGKIRNRMAEYYSPNRILSETYNKYSLLWLPEYYEWRFNNILLRRLYKNETNSFPDSPSIINFSIRESMDSCESLKINSIQLRCPNFFIINDSIIYVKKNSFQEKKNKHNKVFLIFEVNT